MFLFALVILFCLFLGTGDVFLFSVFSSLSPNIHFAFCLPSFLFCCRFLFFLPSLHFVLVNFWLKCLRDTKCVVSFFSYLICLFLFCFFNLYIVFYFSFSFSLKHFSWAYAVPLFKFVNKFKPHHSNVHTVMCKWDMTKVEQCLSRILLVLNTISDRFSVCYLTPGLLVHNPWHRQHFWNFFC